MQHERKKDVLIFLHSSLLGHSVRSFQTWQTKKTHPWGGREEGRDIFWNHTVLKGLWGSGSLQCPELLKGKKNMNMYIHGSWVFPLQWNAMKQQHGKLSLLKNPSSVSAGVCVLWISEDSIFYTACFLTALYSYTICWKYFQNQYDRDALSDM